MDLSRMYRIAETGDVNDPTPVDNVLRMAEERQRQQQQARPQSAWGRFENFAGSNAGRTLWGGLGTALGVGLTGGNLQDALGYGVIGAGNTVGTLNQNRQYANRLALKQQERADALAKEQRDNQFKLGLQDRALAQSKQLADYQLDKTLARLRGEQEIKDTAEEAARQRKIDAINSNPYLTEDQKQWQIARLDGLNFDRSAYFSSLLLYCTEKCRCAQDTNLTKNLAFLQTYRRKLGCKGRCRPECRTAKGAQRQDPYCGRGGTHFFAQHGKFCKKGLVFLWVLSII